jgi:tetratricopeptide (TPR) repeat protein
MRLCQKIAAATLLPLLMSMTPALPAHDGQHDGQHNGRAAAPPNRVLGEISFPTASNSAEAQAAFIQGMLLLHLFEYPFAREQFQRAQQLDPDLAMAYWGEAMTHNHPIWDRQDLQAGRAALAKLGETPAQRLARTPVAREQGLLAAIELLYGEGGKSQRDRAYMRAMERLASEFPRDHEVQLFYALSLFGVQAGVRDTATYMLCTAIAQDVFSENPQHPGAAHYLIHGVDDPLHAVLGLRAARALGQMAPDAGHAQHMTSHIFIAVGMWDEVVSANESAVKVQNAMRAEHGEAPRHWGHYNYWLLYGYLQQGREADALALLEAARGKAQAADKRGAARTAGARSGQPPGRLDGADVGALRDRDAQLGRGGRGLVVQNRRRLRPQPVDQLRQGAAGGSRRPGRAGRPVPRAVPQPGRRPAAGDRPPGRTGAHRLALPGPARGDGPGAAGGCRDGARAT